MRKLLSFALAVVLVFSLAMPAFAATVKQEVSETAITAGEEVTVTVTLDETMENITMYQYSLYYNKDLFSLTSSEGSTAVISNPLSDEDGDYYMISFVDVTSEGQTVEAGTIAVLKFQAIADVTAEQAASFKLEKDYVWDTTFDDTGDGTVENGDVSITVSPVPATTYTVTLGTGAGFTIAAQDSTSPVTEGGSYSFTVTVADGYDGTNMVVKANGTELTAVDGVYTIENITADQTVTVEGVKLISGYSVTTSADVTTTVSGSASVAVNVTGNAAESITAYNDYDVKLTYDPAKLDYVSAVAADTGATITVDETAGTIRVTGHGIAKEFSAAVVTLNFTALASGESDVTITSAKVDNSGNAISENAPEAAVEDAATTIKVAYSVELPEGFTGETSVLPGADYEFTAPNDYYEITVTVGGETVTPEVDGLTYTISGIDGDVVITAVGKTYQVSASGTNASVTAAATAQYGTDYTFTAAANDGYAISNVSVLIDGQEVGYTIDSTGAYVIAGADIIGDITITVTADAQTSNTTQITFSGVESDEVVGGLTQSAENGKDFTFELNEEDGYDYTVTINGTELVPDADGKYTIPGDLINGTALTVVITKEVAETGTLKVEVSEYITLNGKAMWLITAVDGDQVLAYGGKTMYWSDTYQVGDEETAQAGAYCWLVISEADAETVKADAEAAITAAAEGAAATQIAYDKDVNQTGVVDINDAQLTYDMYTAVYDNFDKVTMDKFLEADLNGDMKVYTEDVAAIVSTVVNQ